MLIISTVSLSEGRELYDRAMRGEKIHFPPPRVIEGGEDEDELLDALAKSLAELYRKEHEQEMKP